MWAMSLCVYSFYLFIYLFIFSGKGTTLILYAWKTNCIIVLASFPGPVPSYTLKWSGSLGMRLNYCIFALLSACAYIPTGRKPALNSEVCLIARCAQIETAVSKYACARVISMCSIKGHGQLLAHAIIRITACRPARKGAYFLKSVTIKHRNSNFQYL